MATVNTVCDFIIVRLNEAGEHLNMLKLQKLLYYCQAWHLAINKSKLFPSNFQAWVHGPVNRDVYDRFLAEKSLYSVMVVEDVREVLAADLLEKDELDLITSVLDVYAGLTGSQLESMTHSEEPWIEARKGCSSWERSTNTISDDTMTQYYAQRLAN